MTPGATASCTPSADLTTACLRRPEQAAGAEGKRPTAHPEVTAWVLQAVLVGGLIAASVAARRGAKRLERVIEDLELERAVFLGILGIARRLVSRYEPLESLVDEVPYGCIDCGMQVVDGEGRVIGTVLIPPPALN